MALTHYATLGVDPDATHEGLRHAYLRRVQSHPDRRIELQRAWTVLGEPSSRRIYDRCLGLPVRGVSGGRSSVSRYLAA